MDTQDTKPNSDEPPIPVVSVQRSASEQADKSLPSLPQSHSLATTLQPPLLAALTEGGSSSYTTAKEGSFGRSTSQPGVDPLPLLPTLRLEPGLTQVSLDVLPAVSKEIELEPDPKPEFVPKTKDFGFLPIPPHLRFHPDRPFHFGLGLNVAFGFASTFSAFLSFCLSSRAKQLVPCPPSPASLPNPRSSPRLLCPLLYPRPSTRPRSPPSLSINPTRTNSFGTTARSHSRLEPLLQPTPAHPALPLLWRALHPRVVHPDPYAGGVRDGVVVYFAVGRPRSKVRVCFFPLPSPSLLPLPSYCM